MAVHLDDEPVTPPQKIRAVATAFGQGDPGVDFGRGNSRIDADLQEALFKVARSVGDDPMLTRCPLVDFALQADVW